MPVRRFSAAPAYQAPGHINMSMLRLQGLEASPAERLWLGASHLLPGVGTTLDTSPLEKTYVGLEGEVVGAPEKTDHFRASCRKPVEHPPST